MASNVSDNEPDEHSESEENSYDRGKILVTATMLLHLMLHNLWQTVAVHILS